MYTMFESFSFSNYIKLVHITKGCRLTNPLPCGMFELRYSLGILR